MNKQSHSNSRLTYHLAALCILLVMLFPAVDHVDACNVPVFRYALERWATDDYEVVIFHRGELPPDNQSVVTWLEDAPGTVLPPANFALRLVDLLSDVPESYRELWNSLENAEPPTIAIRYPPYIGYRLSVWSAPLTMESAKTLLDSPARREIARLILDGASAVWVLLESGDAGKNDTAYGTLKTQIAELEDLMRLPEAVEGNAAMMPVDLSGGPSLRIEFPIIRVSKNDPAEAAFVAMLMYTEPDLFEYEVHPMAFPVYGRGRALFALIGDGINGRNIAAACGFLTGACSCEVKGLNPGVDLLTAVDWDAGIGESWVDLVELPPLVGISEMIEVSGAVNDSTVAGSASGNDSGGGASSVGGGKTMAPSEISALERGEGVAGIETPGSTGVLYRNILIALAAAAVVVGLLAFKVTAGGSEVKR